MEEYQKNAYFENQAERSDYEKIKTKTDIALEEAEKMQYEDTSGLSDRERNEEFAANISGSSFGSGLVYAIKYLSRHKNELSLGILFVAAAIITAYTGYDIVKRFLLLKVTNGLATSLAGLVLGIIPFLLWAWSTKYALYNFYKIKRLIFKMCVNIFIIVYNLKKNIFH